MFNKPCSEPTPRARQLSLAFSILIATPVLVQANCCEFASPQGCAAPVNDQNLCLSLQGATAWLPGQNCGANGNCSSIQPVLVFNDTGASLQFPAGNGPAFLQPIVGQAGVLAMQAGLDAAGAAQAVLNTLGITDPGSEPGLTEALGELQNVINNPMQVDDLGLPIVPPPAPPFQNSMIATVDVEIVELQLRSVQPLPLNLPQIEVPGPLGLEPMSFNFRQTIVDPIPYPGVPMFVFTDMFEVELLREPALSIFDPLQPLQARIWTWMYILKKIPAVTERRLKVTHRDVPRFVEVEVEIEPERWVFVQIHSHPVIPLPPPPPPPGLPVTGFTSELILEALPAAEPVAVPLLPPFAWMFGILAIPAIGGLALHRYDGDARRDA